MGLGGAENATEIVLLRHAFAGVKGDVGPDDALRPLDAFGRRTAGLLAHLLPDRPVTAIISSPYVRCVQTVEPLAVRLSLAIVELAALGPLASHAEIAAAVSALPAGAVACTHGEVIRRLFSEAVDCEKGGAWIVARRHETLEPALYVPPPI